jgi:hypothetical protein
VILLVMAVKEETQTKAGELMTDKAALRAIQDGDESALALLIERYAAYVGTRLKKLTLKKPMTMTLCQP